MKKALIALAATMGWDINTEAEEIELTEEQVKKATEAIEAKATLEETIKTLTTERDAALATNSEIFKAVEEAGFEVAEGATQIEAIKTALAAGEEKVKALQNEVMGALEEANHKPEEGETLAGAIGRLAKKPADSHTGGSKTEDFEPKKYQPNPDAKHNKRAEEAGF